MAVAERASARIDQESGGKKAAIFVPAENAGRRLDQFLATEIKDVSRARVQQLIQSNKVLVNGEPARASLRLKGGETIEIAGNAQPAPLRAIAEDIPLDVVYEDEDLAVVNKPAGMMVHAGAGATDDARNRGTLVNALLHRFGSLSSTGGGARPGIVHRLDRNTSGLIVIARNDVSHRKLAAAFVGRQVHKTYLALVHGWLPQSGTINSAISRDRLRRTRMTTRRSAGRAAVSHYRVLQQFESDYGRFSLLEVKIETGRTHQIRVHLASIGHPVVGDTLYGAPREIRPKRGARADVAPVLTLGRQFLHAARLEFAHPCSGKPMAFVRPLPNDLQQFIAQLKQAPEQREQL